MNTSKKQDKNQITPTVKISMAVLAICVWAIVIFAVFSVYQIVSAEMIYEEYDPTGTIIRPANTDTKIGEFTIGIANVQVQSGVTKIGVKMRDTDPFTCIQHSVFIATSTLSSPLTTFSFTGESATFQDLTALAGSSVTLIAGQTYDVYATASCNPGNAEYKANAGNTMFYGYISSDGLDFFDATDTRIISTDPANDEYVATSTIPFTLEVDYFISDQDFEDYGDDDFLRVRYKNDSTSIVFAGIHAISAVTDPWEVTYEEDIVGFGYQNFSTSTSPEEIGRYTLEAYIIRPTISILGFTFGETILARYTDTFIMGTTTAYDDIKDQTDSELEALGLSSVESTYCADDLSILSPIKFAVCLFAFDGEGIAQVFINAREGFLTRVPFGYVTRAVDIFTSTATTSLPTISYTFNEGPLEGDTIDFDPWPYFYVDGAPLKDEIVSNAGGQNIWEIVEPFYEIVVYLTLALLIIKKLTGVHLRDTQS